MILNLSTKLFSPLSHLIWPFVLIILWHPVCSQTAEINQQRSVFNGANVPSPAKLEASLALAQSFRLFSTDSVLKYATTSMDLAEQFRDTSSLAAAYRQLGWSRGLMQQNIAQLIEDVTKAKNLAVQVGDSLEIMRAGLDLSRGLMATQKITEARQQAEQGLAYAERHQLGELRFDALTALAYLAILSDLDLSLSYRRKALNQARGNQDSVGMAVTYSQIASIMKFQKNDSVEYYLQAAKTLFQQKKAPVYEGILLCSIWQNITGIWGTVIPCFCMD